MRAKRAAIMGCIGRQWIIYGIIPTQFAIVYVDLSYHLLRTLQVPYLFINQRLSYRMPHS